MLVSVIIRTKDEAPRLRLTLFALTRQTVPIVPVGNSVPADAVAAEVIVTDDGSTDQTRSVLEEMSAHLPLHAIHHDASQGRSAASNAGSRLARGDVLLFLDGDILASPQLVELHARVQQSFPGLVARGETWHLRCTRFFLDPEVGSPQPGQEPQVRRMGADMQRHLVTRQQVLDQFKLIEDRAQPAIYPGSGPRQLYELEMDALHHHPDLSVLWMTASGHNFSVPRRLFEEGGGFHEQIDMNEHRELAFRLGRCGGRMVPVPDGRSYHLTHRVGWRDPLTDLRWEQIFYQAHPERAVKLMSIFWQSLAGDPSIPAHARIHTLPQLDAIVQNGSDVDYDTIRRDHPLLGAWPFSPARD